MPHRGPGAGRVGAEGLVGGEQPGLCSWPSSPGHSLGMLEVSSQSICSWLVPTPSSSGPRGSWTWECCLGGAGCFLKARQADQRWDLEGRFRERWAEPHQISRPTSKGLQGLADGSPGMLRGGGGGGAAGAEEPLP